jgi:hypothetical protein
MEKYVLRKIYMLYYFKVNLSFIFFFGGETHKMDFLHKVFNINLVTFKKRLTKINSHICAHLNEKHQPNIFL